VRRCAKNVDYEMRKTMGLAPAVYAGLARVVVGKLPAPFGDGQRRY